MDCWDLSDNVYSDLILERESDGHNMNCIGFVFAEDTYDLSVLSDREPHATYQDSLGVLAVTPAYENALQVRPGDCCG